MIAQETLFAQEALSTTRVVHCKKEKYDVYIGRAAHGMKGSIWANPFHIGKDGTREDVIAKYREYILGKPELLGQLESLRGKVLGCWCSPQRCHGDVLVELLSDGLPPEPPKAVVQAEPLGPCCKQGCKKPATVLSPGGSLYCAEHGKCGGTYVRETALGLSVEVCGKSVETFVKHQRMGIWVCSCMRGAI